MKYETAAAFRQALEQRLKDRSRETGKSLVRLRKSVVFDRLLARLAVVAPERWVLKGALALDLRMGDRTRTTKDMDLVRHDDEELATADLIACQTLEFDDFFVFAIEKAGQITEEQDGGAVRYRVRAELAARLFEQVTVDIGFSDALGWQPDRLQVPDFLSFAGIEPIEVPTLPIEQHIAEKVHAYARTYGDGRQSSRVKDLVDLVLIKQSLPVEAHRLRAALTGVFENRGQQVLPRDLPKPPRDWAVPYRKLADEVGIDTDLSVGHQEASAFLDAVLGGLEVGNWNPDPGAWR